jgi:hypothetical protein
LDELTQARLIVFLVVLAVAVFWASGVISNRRRFARFAALAQSFGSKIDRQGEFLSRFAVDMDGRRLEVRCQHIGKRGWFVVTEVPLQGVSELHSADILPRWKLRRGTETHGSDFDRHFKVQDAGYPLRDGWLTERVRGVIAHFYALDLPLDRLSIEEARLIHRSRLPPGRFDGAILRELLTRQVAVAAALERAL